jgi:hypothetical protein
MEKTSYEYGGSILLGNSLVFIVIGIRIRICIREGGRNYEME